MAEVPHITLPLLKPTLLFVFVTGTIAAWQVFDFTVAMTAPTLGRAGGPVNSTMTLVVYTKPRLSTQYGRASAMAYVPFFIVIAISLLQLRVLARWSGELLMASEVSPVNRYGRPTTIGSAVLAVVAATMVLPFIWLALSALKTRAELVAVPPVWVPAIPQWSNFRAAVSEVPLGRYYLNSFIVAGAISISVMITSAMAGFALSKYAFRGRDIVFQGILATMMLPSFLFTIPVYYMMRHVPFAGGNNWLGHGGMGLLRSRLSLILPFAVSAWGVFLSRQFIMGIPDSILDAARIDGASESRILSSIIVPAARPALITVGIYTFISQWNNLFWPLVVATSSPELATLTVGLKMLETSFDPNRNAHLIWQGSRWASCP